MSFGKPSADFREWTLDPTETEEIVRRALALGINFFDTANTYSHGTSEEYLGSAVRNTVARDKVILASKVYFNEGRLIKAAIAREIDGTLRRLAPIISISISFTASTIPRRSRRQWRRSTRW